MLLLRHMHHLRAGHLFEQFRAQMNRRPIAGEA